MERLFGTWQGRLPQELRKACITTMQDANAYIAEHFIPWHNRKLRVRPAETATAFVPAAHADLDAIICLQHSRIVQNDNTVTLGTRTLQIQSAKWRASFAKTRVTVCEHLDGYLSVRCGPRILGWYLEDGTQIHENERSVA